MRRAVILLAILAVVAAACTTGGEEQATPGGQATSRPETTTTTAAPSSATTTSPPTTTTTTTTTVPMVPVSLELEPFGTLAEVPLLTDVAYAGPATPTSFDGVITVPWVADAIAVPEVAGTLAELGFAVVPNGWPLFHYVYESAVYENHPVFVTTDTLYHTWHLVFDKVLRDTEVQQFLPILEDLVAGLVDRARLQRDDLAGTDVADAAARVAEFYEAAAAVLGLDVGPIGPRARAEVALIEDHTQYTTSPITSFGDCTPESPNNCVDYTLFKPRGHYTRSADLERFFRAMSVLGQGAFFLDPDSLRLGVLASRVLLSAPELTESWRAIYEPTAFLVGAADDYTPFELAAVVDDVVSTGLSDPTAFADPATVDAVADGLRARRQIQINPAAPSVRIMGVRFVLDSFILDQLILPNVEARSKPSPLDIAAAFGSELAYRIQEEAGETAYGGYDEKLAELRQLVADRTMADWGATVYDAWLYALEPMWAAHGAAFPDFMQTDAWAAKALQTGFGSYTELKHDTILFAKQAIAEGGGDVPQVLPRHWVEPDPVAFERIKGAAQLLRTGLADRELLTEEHRFIFDELDGLLANLARLARDELAGRPISDEDNDYLLYVGGVLQSLWFTSSDFVTSPDDGPDSRAALVADIARAFEEVLELGTGDIDLIFVLVPNDDGRFQVAVGGVYSYYEFWQPGSDRLDDEQWRRILDEGAAPPRPAWQQVFLAE